MFWIRADGNGRIGAGHLMRCVAVAEALARLADKKNICFVCADEESAALAEEHGFSAQVLGTDYRDMAEELPAWAALAGGTAGETEAEKNVILVDSYQVTDAYLTALRQYGHVVLLEDFGTHVYPADCVINYNAPADPEQYARLYQGQNTRLLIGSRYVPLRGQFLGRQGYPVKERVRNVLITAGGGDSENIAGKILERILQKGICFHLVTGRFNPHFRTLKEWERTCDEIRIYHDVKDMAGLMLGCDLALTAGGSTVYELAALGVPFICFSCAENQEALTTYIGEREIAGYAGAWHKDPEKTLDRMEKLFAQFGNCRNLRAVCREKAQALIDGQGGARIARELLRISTEEELHG